MADEEREIAHFRGEGGQIIGMDLPLDEHMQDKVTKGYLVQVNEDGSPLLDDTANEGSDLTTGVPARPAVNAPKAEWVGFAVRAGGLDPDAAEAMTKQDLIDRFGK
jgi:hypothetical protein